MKFSPFKKELTKFSLKFNIFDYRLLNSTNFSLISTHLKEQGVWCEKKSENLLQIELLKVSWATFRSSRTSNWWRPGNLFLEAQQGINFLELKIVTQKNTAPQSMPDEARLAFLYDLSQDCVELVSVISSF